MEIFTKQSENENIWQEQALMLLLTYPFVVKGMSQGSACIRKGNRKKIEEEEDKGRISRKNMKS